MKKVLILFLVTQYGLSGYIKAAANGPEDLNLPQLHHIPEDLNLPQPADVQAFLEQQQALQQQQGALPPWLLFGEQQPDDPLPGDVNPDYPLSGPQWTAGAEPQVTETTILDIGKESEVTLPANQTTVEINLPAGNPTGLSTATFKLSDPEPISHETLEEMLEEGSARITIGFTKDETGKWHSTFFDEDNFEALKSHQQHLPLLSDPASQLPIQYIVPGVTIRKSK